ncbi:Flagellar basal-body rod protein FlgC [hydrothermal vent metagenome]|uniref:Flagellar basal-body rod protein FlgC n=1 Tax=hydrothermal vent metagenome TaxID=652676 RepID=A0A3B0WL93_9ZZZZ
MALYNVFNIAGSSMSAQSVRLNTVASNLANADVVNTNEKNVYRSRQPIFSAVMDALNGGNNDNASASVRVSAIVESNAPARKEFQPDHPMANKEGYIFKSNVNSIEEMANMMAASRAYQNNVEVFNTSKQLLLKTLNMGQ